MLAVSGYFDGKYCVPLDNISIKLNQKLIITVLDDFVHDNKITEKSYKKFVGKLDDEGYSEIMKALQDCETVDKNEW